MKIKLFPVVLLCLYVSLTGIAIAEPQTSQWNMFIARFKLPNKWRFFLDLQPRIQTDSGGAHGGSGMKQMLVRPAIGYQVTDWLQIFQGYTLVENYEPHKTEHDSIQDIVANSSLCDWHFVHRIRLEQRFLEDKGEVAHRWRFFNRAQHLLPGSETLSFVAYDEAFFNMNDVKGGPQGGFGENRAFVGVNYVVNPTIQVDLGVQDQYLENRGAKGDIVNNSLYLGVAGNFDLS